jgi:hypothetical protein
MAADGRSYLYCAACRWDGEVSADATWEVCPSCGSADVGLSVMQEVRPAPGSPSEFVFSERQKQRTWPTNFWAQLVQRLREGELTMDPRELARGLARFIPGARDRRPPGRPRGGPFRDSADFEARLTDIIVHLHKHHYVITHELIACTLRRLLEEPQRHQDLASVVNEAEHHHEDAKPALANLRRWCVDPKHPVDLDRLIQRLTAKSFVQREF